MNIHRGQGSLWGGHGSGRNCMIVWICMSRRGLISIIVNINEAWWGMTSWELKFFGIFCQRSTRKSRWTDRWHRLEKKSEKRDRSMTSRQSEVLKSSTWEGGLSVWNVGESRMEGSASTSPIDGENETKDILKDLIKYRASSKGHPPDCTVKVTMRNNKPSYLFD